MSVIDERRSPLTLRLAAERYMIRRLLAREPAESSPAAGFRIRLEASGERAAVGLEGAPPDGADVRGGWCLFELVGPFAFETVGVLEAVLAPLAAAGVSILAYSGFDTDYVLVPDEAVSRARAALEGAGHRVVEAAPVARQQVERAAGDQLPVAGSPHQLSEREGGRAENECQRLAALARAVRGSTLKRLRAVPAGSEGWRPADGAMSFADVAHHLVEADRWLLRKLREPRLAAMVARAGETGSPTRADYQRLLAELVETGERRSALLEGLSAAELDRAIPDERFGGEVSAWWVIVRGNLDHEAHHRGQLAAYLRMLGAAPVAGVSSAAARGDG